MMDMTNMVLIANTLADIAGEISRSYFRKRPKVVFKKDGSPVTQADFEIESAIRDFLNLTVPLHGILGEEYGSKPSGTEYTWVIDPIDGTLSFLCGKPTFCTLISLLKNDMPILGIMDQPITKERWQGITGQQSTLNQSPCFAASYFPSASIRLNCTTPLMFTEKEQQKFNKVKTFASAVAFGGDGYAYGLLSSGYIDIIFEADLKYHDVAALMPIVQGAGGSMTDWLGQPIKMDSFDGKVLASSNQALQENILHILNG